MNSKTTPNPSQPGTPPRPPLEIIKNEKTELSTSYDQENQLLGEEYDEVDDDDQSNFLIHNLNNLHQLNREIQEHQLIVKGAVTILYLLLFDRSRLQQIGLTMANVEIILSNTNFEKEHISHPQSIFQEVKQFHSLVFEIYQKNINRSLISTIVYSCLAAALYFYSGWSILTILAIIFALSTLKSNFENNTRKKRLTRWYNAVTSYFRDQKIAQENPVIQENSDKDPFDDILKFQKYNLEQDQRHWTVRVFDFFTDLIANKGEKNAGRK
jgi:hypothetical protein